MNLLGGVAAQGLYQDAAGNDIQGKVHQGFHNMVHDWPTNRLGGLACTEKVAATQVNVHGVSNMLKRLLRRCWCSLLLPTQCVAIYPFLGKQCWIVIVQ
jgi:hypothetical protein